MFGLLIAAAIGVITSWQIQGRRSKEREDWLVQELARVRNEANSLRLSQLQSENTSLSTLPSQAMDAVATVEVMPSEVSQAVENAVTENAVAENAVAESMATPSDEDGSTMTDEADGADDTHTATIVMDNLESIRGIGPTFANRLNNAGILTFADIVARPPEQLRSLASGSKKSKLNVENWIDQAKQSL
ncbi:MAG: helix-hairpin-helix domain-containing protein [Chloroflexota bacterium]